jgi:hypothetical protein
MYGEIQTNYTIDEQLRVWQHLISAPVEIGQEFSSIFRTDNKGSCYLRVWHNQLLFTDWSYPYEYNKYNIVKALMFFGMTYLEAQYAINEFLFFNKPIQTNQLTTIVSDRKRNSQSNISYKELRFDNEVAYTKQFAQYFAKRGITLDHLKKDGVKQAIEIYAQGIKIYFNGIAAVYSFENRFKIYLPFSEKMRFLAKNISQNDIWEWGKKTRTAIITKSYKDGRVLYNTLGYKTFAFQNEGCLPTELDQLKGFEKIYLIFDNDKPGFKSAMVVSDYLRNKLPNVIIKPVFFNQDLGKDADEIFVTYGEQVLINQLNKMLC